MAEIFSWATVFKSIMMPVGKKAVEVASEKLPEVWHKFRFEDAAERYREEMLHRYGKMKILGMTAPVPLGDIYTNVRVLEKLSAQMRDSQELLKEIYLNKGSFGTVRETRSGMSAVKRFDKLFILGKPGAGKTTFLKYLVLQAAEGKIEKIPIFVSLKAYSDSGISMIEFLEKQFEICQFPDATKFITATLQQGKALVLFDGLDEVNTEGDLRSRVVQKLTDFSNHYRKSQIVITCRVAAREYVFEQYTDVEMADFTEEQVDAFVKKWFAVDPETLKLFKEDFAKPDQKGLRELAQSPLLLTLICLAFQETLHFPVRRCDIYEEALDALLKKWDSSRKIRRSNAYHKLSPKRKKQMLAEIAYLTFEKGEFLIEEKRLSDMITTYIQTLPEAEAPEDIDGYIILKEVETQHGILVERSKGLYSFSHLTFQEFLVAQHIVENGIQETVDNLVHNHLLNIQWKEVFLLVAQALPTADILLLKIIRDRNPGVSTIREIFRQLDKLSDFSEVECVVNSLSREGLVCVRFLYRNEVIFESEKAENSKFMILFTRVVEIIRNARVGDEKRIRMALSRIDS